MARTAELMFMIENIYNLNFEITIQPTKILYVQGGE